MVKYDKLYTELPKKLLERKNETKLVKKHNDELPERWGHAGLGRLGLAH